MKKGNEKLKKHLENLLNSHQIPFMQIEILENENLLIKVYFPKIIINLIHFLDKHFILIDKKNIMIKKDSKGYSKSTVKFEFDNEEVKIDIASMLKETWGIESINNTDI